MLRETQAQTETDACVNIIHLQNLLQVASENISPTGLVALRGSAPTTSHTAVALRGSAPTTPCIVGALPRRATACLEPCIITGTAGFDVHFIVDLGREYIGYVDLELNAAEGTLLDVQCFELIDDTGCFYMQHHNGFAYTCRAGYLYGGDMQDLAENYGYVKQNLENSLRLTNARGLLDYDGAANLIEWAANDLSPYGEVTANNIFLAKSYALAADMAEALGRDDEARRFRGLADQTRRAINTYCWDDDRQAYVDTVRDEFAYANYQRFYEAQGMDTLSYEDYLSLSRVSEQTNTLALLYDIAPADRAEKILPILTRVKHGNYIFSSPAGRSVGGPQDGELIDNIVAIGSPFFLFFTIEALFKTGHNDIALEVMRRDWGLMLDHGTKTCWETFKMKGGRYTRSIAHAWSSSPAIYLQQYVLGIKPLTPGFKTFTVSPCESNLHHAGGSVIGH